MATKPKKEALCDYCGSNNELKHIYSAQKSFVSRKVLELLEIITHKNLPNNVGFKVCFICASTLMSTVGVIEKTQKLVDACLLTVANKKKKTPAKGKQAVEEEAKETANEVKESESEEASGEDENREDEEEDVLIDITEDREEPKPKVASPKKINTTIRQRSKSMAALSVNQINQITQNSITGSPKKQLKQTTLLDSSEAKLSPKKQESRQEDNLIDSVKITPAKEIAPKKKVFLQLFGSSHNEQLETESDTDTDSEVEKKMVQFSPQEFECRLCDFKSRFPKQFKEHLTKEHGQQRPRIYFCDACPKTFGVLKSLKDHLSTAHGVILESVYKATTTKSKEDKPKDAKPKKEKATVVKSKPETKEKNQKEDSDPPADSFKALNESEVRNKLVDKVADDYTFAVNGSSASTPMAGPDSPQFQEFKCDICDSEFPTAKLMQEHVKKAHGIEKPKVFKCHVCEKSLATKQTLMHHVKLHQEGVGETKRKILQEEVKTADSVDSSKKEAAVSEDKPAAKKDTTKETKKEKPPKKVKEDKPKTPESPVKIPSPQGIQEVAQKEGSEPPVSLIKALNESAVKKKRLEKSANNEDALVVNRSKAESPTFNEFKCDICDSVFHSPTHMQNHVKQTHGIEKPKIFKCHVCQKSLATKQTLTYHMKLHQEVDSKPDEEEKDVDVVGSPREEAALKRKTAAKKNLSKEYKKDQETEKTKKDKSQQIEETSPAEPQEVEVIMAAPKSPVKKAKKKPLNTSQDDSSPSPTLNGGGKLNKSGKRKLKVNQSLDQDGPASSNNDSTMEEETTSPQQLLNEVNPNVRPHKKARLDSVVSIGDESTLDSTADESMDFNCNQCGKTVTSRRRLDSHIQKKHGVKLQCPVCKASHRLQLDYVAHFADCSAIDGLPCGVPACKKIFADANYLSTHLRKRHQWA
ncbi:hypothetical protein KR074_004928 [Drosophila pseudoananassae]|nr:hypothetical protein KR074_004928 [Drosophila pseudoananassae]